MSKAPDSIEAPQPIFDNDAALFNIFPPKDYIPAESAREGITIFIPAPENLTDHQTIVEFDCPRCSAGSAYSAESGVLECQFCGYQQVPAGMKVGRQADEQQFRVTTLEAAKEGWGTNERIDVVCQSCGTRESVPADMLTHNCAFCGSSRVVQAEKVNDVLRPSALIPVEVDQEQLEEILNDWFSNSWLLPERLKNIVANVEPDRVFLPFWTFDARSSASWRAEVGHTVTTGSGKNRRTKTVWRWESGSVNLTFDDHQISGSKRISENLKAELGTYNMHGLVNYDPDYLAGSIAQAYDIELEHAWRLGRKAFREITRKACRNQASSGKIRNFSMELEFHDESWRYVLLPVLMASYEFDNQTHRIVINGQTGKIFGQRPVDWRKVRNASLYSAVPPILAFIAAAIFNLLGSTEAAGLAFMVGGFLSFVAIVLAGIFNFMGYNMEKQKWDDELTSGADFSIADEDDGGQNGR
ncbi:MAG: hypothetical protein AAGD96_21715 [Chloroflexota bacterium]